MSPVRESEFMLQLPFCTKCVAAEADEMRDRADGRILHVLYKMRGKSA